MHAVIQERAINNRRQNRRPKYR